MKRHTAWRLALLINFTAWILIIFITIKACSWLGVSSSSSQFF